MSGAFVAAFYEPDYRLEYAEHASFEYDEESAAARAVRERQAWAQGALVASLPRAQGVLAEARRRDVPLGAYDPSLAAVPVREAAALEALAEGAFPLNVAVVVADGAEAKQTVELTLARRPRSAEAAWMFAALPQLALLAAAPRASTGAPPHFEADPAVSRVGDRFAVAVTATGWVRAEVRAPLVARLTAHLERVYPAFSAALADPAAASARTGLGRLRPLATLLERDAARRAAQFNPHGPLYDVFAREAREVGRLRFTVLFAPERVDPASARPGPEFMAWLRSAVEPRAAAPPAAR